MATLAGRARPGGRGAGDRPGRGRRPMMAAQRRSEERAAYLFIAPWVIGFVLFLLGPMLFSLGISFYETNFVRAEFVGLGNYARLLEEPLFVQSLKVTFLYVALTVPLRTLLALGIAVLLDRKLALRGLWRTLYYLPAVVSGVAVAVVWGWILNPNDGLLNQGLRFLGLPAPGWFGSERWAIPAFVLMSLWGAGANMLLYLAGLQSIPSEIKEAARVDGAGPLRAFFNVTLPLLTPTIFFDVVLNVIGSFQVFDYAYVLTNGGPNNATLTIVYYLYQQAFRLFDFGYASVIAWVLFAITLVFTLLIVRSAERWVHYEGGLRR